jgi:hypothetical protein
MKLLTSGDGFVCDSLLGRSDDYRRCIALVADGDWEFSDKFKKTISYLFDDLDPDCYVTPRLHHTFLVARPLECISPDSEYHLSYNDKKRLEEAIREYVKQYTVVFDKLIPVGSGVLFAGGDDVLDEVNLMRECFRSSDLIYGERYRMNIIHFTYLRWKKRGPWQEEMLGKIEAIQSSLEEGEFFAKLTVTKISIVEASWLLRPQECKVLSIVDL